MAEQSKAIWEVGEELALHGTGEEIYKPEFFETIQDSIKSLDPVLRELSLDISGSSCQPATIYSCSDAT